MVQKQIKQVQVFGGLNSINYIEIKTKLQKLQQYFQLKNPLQNPLKNIEFIELDECDFVQVFSENRKLFPQLYQIQDVSQTNYTYIIAEQQFVFLDITEFFNHYNFLQYVFKYVPILCGEETIDFEKKSKDLFLYSLQNQLLDKQKEYNYIEVQGIVNGKQHHVNLIVELNKQLCPKLSQNFSTLLKEDYVNQQGEKITYINNNFYVKRKEFIQGGRQNVKGDSTIFGKFIVDESFSILPDRPGILASINQNKRDSNTSEFFITLQDMSHQNLNNICFGKVVYGIEDLLQMTNQTENTEVLDWKITSANTYNYDERDWIQQNGTMRLNQLVSLKQELEKRKKEIEKKEKQEQEERERKEQEEKKVQEKAQQQQFEQESLEYKRKLYHERQQKKQAISISQSKTEFQLAHTLKNEIIHNKDQEKQQHIDTYLEQVYACRQEHQQQLKESYDKLMDQNIEEMKKYGVKFPTDQDYEDQIYHTKLRESSRIKQLKQDQSVFNVQYISELPKPVVPQENEGEEGGEQQQVKPKVVEAPIVFSYIPVFEDLSYLYPEFIFLTKYQLLGKYARLVTVLDKNTNMRYILKQFSDLDAFNEELQIRKQLDELIEKQPELAPLITKVHVVNENTKVIQYEGGECSLAEYTQIMANNNVYWFQDKQKRQFNQIITLLYKMMNTFFTNKLYFAGNIRPENIILYYDNEYIDLKIRVVDCGGLSIQDFSQVQSQVAAYCPHEVNGFEFKTEEERIHYEFYLLGRVILKLMNDTINYSENKRYDLVKKIDISNFETFFTPFDPENNKCLFEKVKQYFDEFHINLLNTMLIERAKDKIKKQMDILRKDAKNSVYQLYDYDNLIRENNKQQIPLNLEYEECVLQTLEMIQSLELYELSLKIIKQQSKEFQRDPWLVFFKINAFFQLNWDTKLTKYVQQLQEEGLLDKIEKQDPEYFHKIYLLSMKAEYNDINNEQHMQKIEAYLRTFNSYFETQQGEMSEKHINSILLQGQFLQSLIGKVTNKQPQVIYFRKNGEKISDFVKKGNAITPLQQAQNLFLKSYGYSDPSEDTKQEILDNHEEAKRVLEQANLTRTKLFCQILQNIAYIQHEKSQDDEVHMKNLKKLLSFQQRALGPLDPSYSETVTFLVQYFHKNKAKQNMIPLAITDLLYTQCLSVVQAKLTDEQVEKCDYHNLKGQCGQENQIQHMKDYLNKAQELEQQQRFEKALYTYKAAQHINNFHLQKKKDFEDNKTLLQQRIDIVGDKLRILNSEDKENIRIELLFNFIDKHEENFNNQDTYFYLSNLFPYMSISLENNFQTYILQYYRLREKIDKIKQESKRWSFEFGIINIQAVYCHLKMHQRYVMTYYLYLIEEVVGGEWQNSGLLRKKNQVPIGCLQRITMAVQSLASYQYKLDPIKYIYLNV